MSIFFRCLSRIFHYIMGRQNDLHHIRRPCIRITKERERSPSHHERERFSITSWQRQNDLHHISRLCIRITRERERFPSHHGGERPSITSWQRQNDRTTCITSGDLAFASLERENDLHHIMGERPSTTSWQRQNDILGEGPPFTSWEKDSLRAPNSKSCLIMDRFAFQQFCQITIVGKYSPYMGTQITLLQIAASMCTVEYSLYLPITVQLTDI